MAYAKWRMRSPGSFAKQIFGAASGAMPDTMAIPEDSLIPH
jgi:hypothetical protein